MVSHNHEDHRSPRDEGQRRNSARKSRPKRHSSSRTGGPGEGHNKSDTVSDSSFDSKDSVNLIKIVPAHSVMDFLILAVFSVVIASGIVIGVYGYRNVVDRAFNLDLFDVILQLLLFAGLIGIIMYILLRLAAHYIVYLGISVFLNLIFLLKPDKAKASMKTIYNKK